MNLDLLCLGGAAADIILRVPRHPAIGEKLVVDFAMRVGGGAVANTACAAARLGLRTAWAGLLGDDEGGRIARDEFAAFGVDVSLAEIRAGLTTDFTVILLEPSGERTILIAPQLPSPPPLTEAARAALGRARVVYTIPYPRAAEWFLPLAEAVHHGGGIVAVDVEASAPARGEDLRAALDHSDLIFCSRGGLALAAGLDEPASSAGHAPDDGDWLRRGAEKLIDGGATCVAVTLGERGAWAFRGGEAAHVLGHAVPVADTTGAGDCFHAAFLVGSLAGWPLVRTLQFANAAGAISVQKVGPRGGLPSRDQVEDFLDGVRSL